MTNLLAGWFDDLRIATAFLTRIPVTQPNDTATPDFARAHRAFPLVGALIGAMTALTYLAIEHLNLPPIAAAALALGAGALLTGALHEDGFADLADGFGGGRDRAAKLEIMRDSRLGTYGALALIVDFTAKAGCLAALPAERTLGSLIAAHAMARSAATVIATLVPNARSDGLSAASGRPSVSTMLTSIALSAGIAFVALPPLMALAVLGAVSFSSAVLGWISLRQIGGQTGDVLGAVEQVAEIVVLLVAAALPSRGH